MELKTSQSVPKDAHFGLYYGRRKHSTIEVHVFFPYCIIADAAQE